MRLRALCVRLRRHQTAESEVFIGITLGTAIRIGNRESATGGRFDFIKIHLVQAQLWLYRQVDGGAIQCRIVIDQFDAKPLNQAGIADRRRQWQLYRGIAPRVDIDRKLTDHTLIIAHLNGHVGMRGCSAILYRQL